MERTELAFDYDIPHKCEFEIHDGIPGREDTCDEPAAYRGWWEHPDKDAIWLCEYHWQQIKTNEVSIGEEPQAKVTVEEWLAERDHDPERDL
jgi:hypothetical protein